MEYGLIGQRLAYSSSKEIHALFADYDYQNVVLTREDLPGFFASRDFKGINVTAPYKKDVLPFLDEVDDLVERTGVVNTVINRNGRLIGYNTDYPGMISLIKRCGITLTGKKVLIAGSGGASLTAKAVADFFGAREVWRVSRTGKEGCLTYGQAAAQHEDADIWINTTPCGSYPVPGYAPFDIELYPYLIGVIDCVYNPLRSFIVRCICGDNPTGYLHFRATDIKPVQNLVENLLWNLIEDAPNRRSIDQMTMGLMFVHLMNHTEMLSVGSKEQETMVRVLRYIEENYLSGSLAQVASMLHYDQAWLSREIKRRTKKNFTQLMQEKRLSQAAWLLQNTDENVSDIAIAVGYENISYFHRLFAAHFGVSPRAFRKQPEAAGANKDTF